MEAFQTNASLLHAKIVISASNILFKSVTEQMEV